jgi:DNA-binding transcriptional regulator YhcF (GntR family)
VINDKFNPNLPIYLQIIESFQRAIARGELRAGDRVPAVRELAGRLVVNPNTIQRAYQELERDGLFVTRRGLGTFVAESPGKAGQLRIRLAEAAARTYLAEMKALGYTRKEALEMLAGARGAKVMVKEGGHG